MMMYMMARNLAKATATLEKFYNNAGVAVFQKVISDDATTYTEAKMVAGT